MNTCKIIRNTIAFAAFMSVFSCANPGRPDGGPYDETPPKIVGTTPAEYSVNNIQQRITLMFDEYIRLNNAAEKVVISPPQLEQPEIRASGRKILIELRDSLRANTTYTIDFSDAIEDNNEGNPMESYAFVFSTGENIDTMEVSGKVLDASNLEPVKGILVGLHSNLEDSAFTTTPLEHIGRTDGSGKFVIKGLAPGKYRIYALNDAENDFIFKQKSEDIAFTEDIIIPTSEPATRQDTTWVDSVLIDTIKTVAYTHYMPDDIVLRSFKETLTQRHLLKTERKDPFSFTIYFTAASKHFPELKGINFDEKDAFAIQSSETNDTITYWVRDTAVVAKDTLAFKLTYEETDDSTGQNIMTTDTLELISRISYSRIMKDREEAMEKWNKEREKALKRGKRFRERQPRQWIRIRYFSKGTMAPTDNLKFLVNEPLEKIDSARVHLMLAVDTLWEEQPFIIENDTNNMLGYTLYGEWRPDQRYKLRVDSAAFTSIYGNNNLPLEMGFSIPPLDTYASLFVTLSNYDNGQAYVQLLNGDKPTRTVKADGDHADFFYLSPGKYYMRMFVDQNNNGEWDTGLFSEKKQPEPVYYYPEAIELRARWDTELPWNVRSVPLIEQKPEQITKQKPDRKKTILNRNAQRELKKRSK